LLTEYSKSSLKFFEKMNSKNIEQVQKTLNQLSIIIETLNSNKSSLIDFDLSLEKTRLLYEQLSNLKLEKLSKKSKQIGVKNIHVEKAIIPEETISDEIDKEALKYIEEKESIDSKIESQNNTNSNVSFQDVENEMMEMEELTTTESSDENIEFVDEVSYDDSIEKSESKTKEPKQTDTEVVDTIADKFENKRSLNDILSNIKNDEDFATQLQNRPIKDLRDAISLNDKIWFTRELFEGNNDNYLTSIEVINNARSIEDAIKIADTFDWDQEESSTKRFLELIYRRFV